MSNPKVLADYNLTIPTAIGGQNKDTYDTFSLWVQAGYPKTDDKTHPPGDPANAPTVIEPDVWYVSLDAVFLWCDNGAEIENYQGAYHELADPLKNCPYSTADPLENWMEWGVVGDSHAPIQIGNFWYRSMLEGIAGIPIVCTMWFDYMRQPNTNTTGIQRIISVDEFQQIQAAAAA